MRYTTLICGLVLLPALTLAQHITESPMNYKKRISSLFSGNSSIIMMSLKKDYEVGGVDTTYSCQISVSETNIDISNFSIGFTSFSAAGVLGSLASTSLTLDSKSKTIAVLLEKDKFLQFYKCVNDVYKAAGLMAFNRKTVNALCTCGVDQINFGGEYAPDAIDKQRFYFELGGSVFTMTKEEFEEIVKFVVRVRQTLEKV
jgi:hypothetical protein